MDFLDLALITQRPLGFGRSGSGKETTIAYNGMGMALRTLGLSYQRA